MLARLLADIILVVHVAFIVFVIGGVAVTLLGGALRWAWVHNRWFRLAHLAAVGIVVLQQWWRMVCPLTVWEDHLRRSIGQAGYDTGFIAHWLHQLIFFEFPQIVFDIAYTGFGLLVVLSFWLVPVHWRGKPLPAKRLGARARARMSPCAGHDADAQTPTHRP